MRKQAKFIVEGDVFEYDGRTQVAIDDYHAGYVWVTRVGNYKGVKVSARYANAAPMEVNGNVIINYEHIPTIAECEEAEDRLEDSFY